MKSFALAALLAAAVISSSGSPAAAGVDWSNQDPMSAAGGQVFQPQRRHGGSGAPSSGAPGAPSSEAGRFDYFLLSLEWHPAFCAAHGGLSECAPGTSDAFDHDLVLHGLWPSRQGDRSNSYGFCGVPQSVRQLDTAATRCQMPAVPMSSSTRDELAAHMPGTDACLERHEWYRHGTCSGLSGDDYFRTADAMLAQAIRSSLGRFVSQHVGQTVSASDVMAAAAQDWGGAAGSSVRLNCQNGDLSEVRIALDPSVTASSDLGSSLVANEQGSNCPSSFDIVGGAGFRR